MLVLLFNQLGYYFLYSYQQYSIKQENKHLMLASLKDDELFKININDTLIKWEEENIEFSWHGELFDVVKQKEINGQRFLLCLNDAKENELIKKYSNSFSKSNSDKKSKLKLQFVTFIVVNDDKHTQQLVCNFGIQNCFYKTSKYFQIQEVSAPPPKSFFI